MYSTKKNYNMGRIFVILGLVGMGMGGTVSMSDSDKRGLGLETSRSEWETCQRSVSIGGSLSSRCLELLDFSESDLKKENDRVDGSKEEDGDYILISNMISITEEGGDANGESLNPTLPPSNRRRNWALGFGLITLFAIISLLWIYRHSLPFSTTLQRIQLPFSLPSPIKNLSSKLSLPGFRTNLSIPTIGSSTFSFSLPSYKSQSSKNKNSPRFRPDSISLLRWSEEEDPSLSSSSRRSSTSPSSSSWRSKLPRLPGSKRTSGGRGGGTVVGGFFIGEPEYDEEEVGMMGMGDNGYEEVGLLPSPGKYNKYGGYGSV